MYLAQKIHFVQDVSQMTAIALVSEINHYKIFLAASILRHPVQ